MAKHCISALMVVFCIGLAAGQRIMTIQLDGVQYFISRMNPYSPELNYFLAYQYCRSLGLQLASFETKEKADSITQYLKNAGYDKFDFWTSGNRLGTDMFLWMSTGLPFNATFNYMRKSTAAAAAPAEKDDNNISVLDLPSGSTSPQRTARESSDSGSATGCVVLKSPHLEWDIDNCVEIKDFICEQTRCYYYNYGSILVKTKNQGSKTTTTALPPLPPSTTAATTVTTENVKNNLVHINKLMSILRQPQAKQSDFSKDDTNHPVFQPSAVQQHADVDLEQATNGPYDNFNVPSSAADLQDSFPNGGGQDSDTYNAAATNIPETITTKL